MDKGEVAIVQNFDFDKEVENYTKHNRDWFVIDFWFERRTKELWSRNALLIIVCEWALARSSKPAVALLCEAILYFGERKDLALLDELASDLRESCAHMIANCIYGVRRRSLVRE